MALAVSEPSKELPPAKPPTQATVTERSSVTMPERGVLDDEVLRALSSDGANLVDRLQRGDIRLVNTVWLVQQPTTYRIQRRQELETLEASGASPSPLLSSETAVWLLKRGDRSVGALSCMLHRFEHLPSLLSSVPALLPGCHHC